MIYITDRYVIETYSQKNAEVVHANYSKIDSIKKWLNIVWNEKQIGTDRRLWMLPSNQYKYGYWLIRHCGVARICLQGVTRSIHPRCAASYLYEHGCGYPSRCAPHSEEHAFPGIYLQICPAIPGFRPALRTRICKYYKYNVRNGNVLYSRFLYSLLQNLKRDWVK